ncbi:MAG: hypothetical protein H6566_00630 [Lewinellaceae bacterium]|nr:hypothetical protein [Lewinellaceae bacterium]
MQVDKYVELLAAVGLKVGIIEDNPKYAILSPNAKGASKSYGMKSISLLAIKKQFIEMGKAIQ